MVTMLSTCSRIGYRRRRGRESLQLAAGADQMPSYIGMWF